MSLRGAVDANQKPNFSDWSKKKFEGVLLVDQDGTISKGGQVSQSSPWGDHTYMYVPRPPTTAGIVCDQEGRPTVTQDVRLGFEGVPADSNPPTQPMEFSVDNFFADPSVLFSGPSSTGFTGIGDQYISGDAMNYLFGNL